MLGLGLPLPHQIGVHIIVQLPRTLATSWEMFAKGSINLRNRVILEDKYKSF